MVKGYIFAILYRLIFSKINFCVLGLENYVFEVSIFSHIGNQAVIRSNFYCGWSGTIAFDQIRLINTEYTKLSRPTVEYKKVLYRSQGYVLTF